MNILRDSKFQLLQRDTRSVHAVLCPTQVLLILCKEGHIILKLDIGSGQNQGMDCVSNYSDQVIV